LEKGSGLTMPNPQSRQTLLQAKSREKIRAEAAAELARLSARPDYRPELAYFLDLFREGSSVSDVARRVGRPVAALLCLQAPLELFQAAGWHPFKIFSGSLGAGQVTAPRLPALTCPVLRSALGELGLEEEAACAWVIPTTCDWVVKFREMMRLGGLASAAPVHWLELPHLKDSARARDRWLAEVVGLKDFLARSGGRPTRGRLLDSLAAFQKTRRAFSRLVEARRAGRVPAVWFFLIANSFFLDGLESWTTALEAALPIFQTPAGGAGTVFLAGSPIYFPNFKLLHLLEAAGLTVAADDLCSSERLFPVSVAVDDPSEIGLLKALAESYHQGCLCPTFGDNERRINNIWSAAQGSGLKGVIFHVLKGCHPYDLESLALEEPIKRAGLRFIKLETDFAAEDSRNLLARLEAFGNNLGSA